MSKRVGYAMVASGTVPANVLLRQGRALYFRVPAFMAWITGRDGQGADAH